MSLGFTCEHCGFTSYHPRDAEERYCAQCRHFCEDVETDVRTDDETDGPVNGAQTIGQLHASLPEGQWVELPEHGVRVKRLPPFPESESHS